MQILDILQHGEHKQLSLLVDTNPNFVFERLHVPNSPKEWLVAEDSGFFKFYYYERPTERCKAFAGRKFEIPLKTGEILHAYGQWWDGVPPQYTDTIVSVGYATAESLSRTYIFSHIYVSKALIDQWMIDNNVKNVYDIYKPARAQR